MFEKEGNGGGLGRSSGRRKKEEEEDQCYGFEYEHVRNASRARV